MSGVSDLATAQSETDLDSLSLYLLILRQKLLVELVRLTGAGFDF